MNKLTRENIKIEPLLKGSDGENFEGIEKIPDSMLDIMLNGPAVMGIKKGEFRGLARQLYAALQIKEACAEPENKPLTLEQLRKMDGEPVWCELYSKKAKGGKFKAWGIVDSWGVDFLEMHLDFDYYDKSWKAYSRKPEQEEK